MTRKINVWGLKEKNRRHDRPKVLRSGGRRQLSLLGTLTSEPATARTSQPPEHLQLEDFGDSVATTVSKVEPLAGARHMQSGRAGQGLVQGPGASSAKQMFIPSRCAKTLAVTIRVVSPSFPLCYHHYFHFPSSVFPSAK